MRKVEFILEEDIEFERYAVTEDGVLKGRLSRRKKLTSANSIVQLFMMNARRYWTMSPSLNGHTGGAGTPVAEP